ncbi:MAG: nicotinate-nucleotide--dimethylbenzimidazole phosphoribosyltransferase [Nitrospirae bacterium GWC1_57_7]|nr:MAG: nicotinate-nucleotide--dimethylbenzimidazole phosphoribosyltransferase [Nitrospirae bacterium GWC1_57_7]
MSKLQDIIKSIQPVDASRALAIQERLDNLTKPQGSLGRLEELAKKYCLITGKDRPQIRNKIIFTFAGDHGVTEEGVSAFPKEVTPQMVYNVLRGGAGVNVLARHAGARVIVVDAGVDHDFEPAEGLEIRKVGRGTRNMTKGPAMTRAEAEQAVLVGIEMVEKYRDGLDIIGTGDMGIGNTTPSSAIVSVITGTDPEQVTGRGTGIDDKSLRSKAEIIRKAISVNKPDRSDALDVLAKVGGFEIAGIAGLVLGAARYRIPVVVDGFISTAGALIAAELNPAVKGYIIAAHQSVEIGHRKMLAHLEQVPLLDLNLRLGEGTGAALGISLVEAGVKILTEMATFADAGVSEQHGEGEKVGR